MKFSSRRFKEKDLLSSLGLGYNFYICNSRIDSHFVLCQPEDQLCSGRPSTVHLTLTLLSPYKSETALTSFLHDQVERERALGVQHLCRKGKCVSAISVSIACWSEGKNHGFCQTQHCEQWKIMILRTTLKLYATWEEETVTSLPLSMSGFPPLITGLDLPISTNGGKTLLIPQTP